MVYTITLNPAIDCVLFAESINFDRINRATAEHLFFGGKGINVSAVLTRLGVQNKALGFVAGFTGQMLEDMLKAENIKCDFNRLKSGNTRINVKLRCEKELDINADGPIVDKNDIELLLKKLDTVSEGDYIVLAGSASGNLPSDIYGRILKKFEGRQINFVVDAEGDTLVSTLKHKPFLIKPNHYELGDIFGVKTDTEEKAVEYAKKLQNAGAKNVLVSMAEKGAILVDESGNKHSIGNAKGTLVNSTGCGDSMVAGFIAGYIQKRDYGYALRLASACSNATAFSNGLADKEKIDIILNNDF